MSCNPRRAGEIAAATLHWIRENVPGATDAEWDAPLTPAEGGMTTFIWFGQLRGGDLPDAFRAPLALRVFGDVDDDETLEHESSILSFVAAHGFPAPVPVAVVPSRSTANPVGLPWMVLPRIPGDPLLTVIAKRPWAAPRRLRELAVIQARLHAIPVSGVPLPGSGPLVDRWLAEHGPEIEGLGDARANAMLDALRVRADAVRAEEAVVCHGDFHPLNVVSNRTVGGWHHVVIDWTDATVGDRHFDVARTLALFRVAALAASSTTERVVLRGAAPGLARAYRRAYQQVHPLDPDRLAYWTAAHFLRGWAQITQLHAGAYDTARVLAGAIPISAADAVLGRGGAGAARVAAFGALAGAFAAEQREAAPLPDAVDVREPGFADPLQLEVHVAQPVVGVVPSAHLIAPSVVELLGRAGDDLEVAEPAARREQTGDLRVEGALAVVRDVMDRERRDDRVERARGERERIVEIVGQKRHARIAVEASRRRFQHRRRHVHARRGGLRVRLEHERRESPVAAPEVEHATGECAGEIAHEHQLAFSTVGESIGAREVFRGPLDVHPRVRHP